MRPKSLCLLSAIVLALPLTGRAQTIYTGTNGLAKDTNGNGGAGNSKSDTDVNPVAGPSSHSITVSFSSDYPTANVDFTESASSTATASGSDGKLHLTAQSQASIAPNYYAYFDFNTNQPVFIPSPLVPTTGCAAWGSIFETIQITSSTLPSGSPVDIAVQTTLDCTVTAPGYGGANCQAFLQFFDQNGNNYLDDNGSNYYGDIEHSISNGVDAHDVNQFIDMLHTHVGDIVNVEFDASVGASASADWGRPNNGATADAGNTAYFTLDPLTPNTDYAIVNVPVPEPTSLGLIAIAALPLMQRRRRTR